MNTLDESSVIRTASAARVDFALSLRRRWATEIYPELCEQVGPPSGGPTTEALRRAPAYRWFEWLERNSQKLLWRAVQRSVRHQPPVAPQATLGSVELDAHLDLPEWYTAVDIHLQPGGVWSTDEAAAVYELGAKLVMLGDNNDYTFHRLFGATVLNGLAPRQIVDLGCGFGKSTWALKEQFPDADVVGVDLAAPLLRAAHRLSSQRGTAVDYRQADARATGLADGCADLITSTMLLHELPPSAIAELFVETVRLLRPGGIVRMLDFQLTGEPVRDAVMIGHGERNNEPYMPMLFRTDVPELCHRAGLVDARWCAFDERELGLLDDLSWPQRSEWHFPWAVLSARRPEIEEAISDA